MLARLADDHAPVLLGDPPPDVPGGQRQADGACAAECAEAGHRGRLALRAVVTVVTVAVLVIAVLVVACVVPLVIVPLVVVTLVVPVLVLIVVALVPVLAVAMVAVPIRLMLFR
jgi:hypothetical protein